MELGGPDILTVDIKGLLHFFDEKTDWGVGHATGIVGIVGEYLNTACLQRYIRALGGEAVVLSNPDTRRPLAVTTGHAKGPRLNQWVRVAWPRGST